MPVAEVKTKPTRIKVTDFIEAIGDDARRRDCRAVHAMMKRISKAEPKMWGPSIVGYGDQHYRSQSGREGDWFLVGFSPRKQNLTVYISGGFGEAGPLLEKLGKHKTSKGGCLYLDSLDTVHVPTLEKLIARSVQTGIKNHKLATSPKPAARAARSTAPARRKTAKKA
jgi:hypothetical protein